MKIKSKNICLICLINVIYLLCAVGCTQELIKLQMLKSNPTLYIYHSNIDILRKKIHDINHFYRRYKSISHQDNLFDVYYDHYKADSLKSNKYKDGFWIEPRWYYDEYANTSYYSKCYMFSNGDSVKNRMQFFLNITPIDTNRTKVEVFTIYTELVVGETLLSKVIGGAMGHTELIYKKIEPTTIEEYELLLAIGDLVGEKDKMPPLILPQK